MTTIQRLTEAFVSDITAIIRQSALDTVSQALGARPKRIEVSGNVRGQRARPKGAKRSAAELDKLTDSLRSHIAAHPGQRIEQIGKAMGIPTKELALPARKLIAGGQVRTKGEKRATEYYPG